MRNKKGPETVRECLECGEKFYAQLKEIRRGYGKFCTRSCSSTYNLRNMPKKEPRLVDLECAKCGKPFKRKKSRLGNSKHGVYFCSRNCKDLGQRLSEGIVEIHPEHYGKDVPKYGYRKIAFSEKPRICERCGFDKDERILHVHHIDRDRENNRLENLEILCLNCHTMEHLEEKMGV